MCAFVCVRVRACVRASERASERACVRACVCVCVFLSQDVVHLNGFVCCRFVTDASLTTLPWPSRMT